MRASWLARSISTGSASATRSAVVSPGCSLGLLGERVVRIGSGDGTAGRLGAWRVRQVVEVLVSRRVSGGGAGPAGRSGREDQDLETAEGVEQLASPRPVLGEAEEASPAAGDDEGGGVPEAVAEPFRFGGGEVTVEDELLGPGKEVLGDQDQGEPGLVDGERMGREVGQAGVF